MTRQKHTTILFASPSVLYPTGVKPAEADSSSPRLDHRVSQTQVLQKMKWPHLWIQAHQEPLHIDPVLIQPGSDPQIILRTSGNLQLNVTAGGTTRRYQSRAGDLFITPAQHEPYQLEWRSLSEQPIRTLHLYLSSQLLAQTALEVAGVDAGRVELWNGSCLDDPLLRQLSYSLGQELQQPALGSPLFTETAAQLMAIHLLRHHCTFTYPVAEPRGKLTPAQLRQLDAYILAHLDQPIPLVALAGVACLSAYHFCRLFKRTVGVSPHQYVIEQRLKKAQALLRLGQSVAQVADAVGYQNEGHFTLLFRRHVGCSPARYRHLIG